MKKKTTKKVSKSIKKVEHAKEVSRKMVDKDHIEITYDDGSVIKLLV